MKDRDKLISSIFGVIDEINGQLPKASKLEKSMDTSLFGDTGPLDSLGLISLVTAVEQKIEDDFGQPITILENVEALENENPFETVETLASYLAGILDQRK